MLNKTFTHNEDLIIIGRTKLDNLNNNGAGDDGKLSNSTCEHAAAAAGQDEDNRSQVTRRSQSKTTTPTPTQFRATLVHLICKSKAGPIGLALLIGGALINFALVYTNQLPPTWFHTFPDPDQKSYYFGKYLTKAWTHLTTFIIGLYAGYLCRASIQLMALAPAPTPASASTSASIASGQSMSCGACGRNGRAPSRQRQQQQQRDGECIVQVFKNGPKAAQMAQQNGLGCSNKLSEDTSCYDNGSGESSRTVTCTNLPPLVAQLAALTCLLSIIFCTFSWSTSELPTPLVSALYDSLSRLIWSLALAGLMIKLCTPSSSASTSSSGACGGQPLADYKYSRLSSVFSHPLCLLLGRLSFLAYLVAPYVHTLVLGLQEQSLFPSLYLIFHVSLGNIVITYALALILSLLIEQPIKLVVEQLCNCCLDGGGCGEASGADDSEGSEDITSVSNSASTLATSPTQTPTTAISVASLATSAS